VARTLDPPYSSGRTRRLVKDGIDAFENRLNGPVVADIKCQQLDLAADLFQVGPFAGRKIVNDDDPADLRIGKQRPHNGGSDKTGAAGYNDILHD
jgi:hypothetical protein